MALWLLGLYIFSPCMVAAPLIVLERKSLRLALSKSSKLLKALSSDSVSWFSGQQCHLIKLVAFLSLGIVVLDWITRISFTNIASNYEAQMHLFPSHVFRSIALGLVHVVAFLPLYSTWVNVSQEKLWKRFILNVELSNSFSSLSNSRCLPAFWQSNIIG